jgi:hypothetical protein
MKHLIAIALIFLCVNVARSQATKPTVNITVVGGAAVQDSLDVKLNRGEIFAAAKDSLVVKANRTETEFKSDTTLKAPGYVTGTMRAADLLLILAKVVLADTTAKDPGYVTGTMRATDLALILTKLVKSDTTANDPGYVTGTMRATDLASIALKATLASPTFTGTITFPALQRIHHTFVATQGVDTVLAAGTLTTDYIYVSPATIDTVGKPTYYGLAGTDTIFVGRATTAARGAQKIDIFRAR